LFPGEPEYGQPTPLDLLDFPTYPRADKYLPILSPLTPPPPPPGMDFGSLSLDSSDWGRTPPATPSLGTKQPVTSNGGIHARGFSGPSTSAQAYGLGNGGKGKLFTRRSPPREVMAGAPEAKKQFLVAERQPFEDLLRLIPTIIGNRKQILFNQEWQK